MTPILEPYEAAAIAAMEVEGLVSQPELRFLGWCTSLAPKLRFVELGTYRGRSTKLLAQFTDDLLAIDKFEPFPIERGAFVFSTAEIVRENLGEFAQNVTIIEGDSATVPEGTGRIGLLHIDSEHSQEHLNKELDVWLPRLASGGVVVLHDYDHLHPLRPLIRKRLQDDPSFVWVGKVERMVAFQRVGDRRVTVILTNYERPENLTEIIRVLRQQTEPCDIWLIDNSGPHIDVNWPPYGMVDRFVAIPWNAGPSVRVPFALYAETPWVMFLDDDLVPTDRKFLAAALEVAEKRPDSITGVYGRRLANEPPYYREDAKGRVEIIKGRMMLFRPEILADVRMPAYPPQFDRRFVEDIYVSLETGRGEAKHWVHPSLQRRLRDLPTGGTGLCERPEHMAEREGFCEWWLESRL